MKFVSTLLLVIIALTLVVSVESRCKPRGKNCTEDSQCCKNYCKTFGGTPVYRLCYVPRRAVDLETPNTEVIRKLRQAISILDDN